jgi:hypothetical protein
VAEIKGGEKLQRALVEITAKLDNYATLHVGFLQGARYPDGTSVAMVAAIMNYGAPRAGIPPRPFFSQMIAAKSPEWPAAMAGLLKSTGYDTKKTLALTGEAIKGQLQTAIRDFDGVPLKPATIKRKGHSKPLVDTGQLLNSVAYEVKE